MIYSMIGIPLVLTILSDLGMVLFRAMKYVHIRLRFLFRQFRSYEFPSDISEISVTSAFLLWIVWMCMSAGIFLIWEDWTYFESLYFFFITLTTIGLGINLLTIIYKVVCHNALFKVTLRQIDLNTHWELSLWFFSDYRLSVCLSQLYKQRLNIYFNLLCGILIANTSKKF